MFYYLFLLLSCTSIQYGPESRVPDWPEFIPVCFILVRTSLKCPVHTLLVVFPNTLTVTVRDRSKAYSFQII